MAATVTCIHADYAAKATDGAVLQRPLKSELMPTEIKDVFGYPRNLKERWAVDGIFGCSCVELADACLDTGRKLPNVGYVAMIGGVF